jgi:hypothetical protein
MDIWNPEELIDNDAIDNLTDAQVEEVLAILSKL